MRMMTKFLTRTPERIACTKRLLRSIGYEPMHWVRFVMYRECFALVRSLDPDQLDVCEISAGQAWQTLGFRSYTEMNYPEYDICDDVLDRSFDLFIADNVFEHLAHPYKAARNILRMLKPGGHFLNITPFMIRGHAVPIDCTRWTEQGMRYFLEDCGFERETLVSGSWGNRACVKSNFRRWTRVGWRRSFKNEPDFPVQVWALARKPGKDEAAGQ